MNVKLLSSTEDPVHLIWTAARTCYSEVFPEELWEEEVSMKRWQKLFEHLYFSGHHSVFEHVNFTFAISGVTRQTTHQLVRHRHGSYSQQSMRYVNMENAEFNIPEPEGHTSSLKDIVLDRYNELLDEGMKKEDARRVMPIGTLTNMVVTYNLRSLIDIAYERRCVFAQLEIRSVVNKMREEVSKIFKPFGKAMAIKCQQLGYCPEERNEDGKCKIRPHFNATGLKRLKLL